MTNREHILERLINNQDDLYVMGQVPNNIDAIAEVFLDNPMIVLAAIDHPLANSEKISLNRISEEFFIMRESIQKNGLLGA